VCKGVEENHGQHCGGWGVFGGVGGGGGGVNRAPGMYV